MPSANGAFICVQLSADLLPGHVVDVAVAENHALVDIGNGVHASILDMDFKTSVLAIMGGVLLASVIMLLASSGVFGAIGALLA